MTDKTEEQKKPAGKGTLSLKAPVGAGAVRQNVAMGRSAKPVAVEVKKKRGAQAEAAKTRAAETPAGDLNMSEQDRRIRALQQAQSAPKDAPTTAYQTKLVIKHQEAEEEKPAPTAAASTSSSPAASARNKPDNDARNKPTPTSFIAPPADKKPTGRKVDFYGRAIPDATEEMKKLRRRQ